MADTDIAVVSLAVTGGLKMLTAAWTWTSATSPLPYLQLDYFEVWVATTNNRALATNVANANDLNYALTGLGYSTTRYFWIRPIDLSGNEGDFYPLSATAGIGSATLSLLAAADIADGSLPGTKLVAYSVTASRMVLADSTNLIPDPDFNDTTSWSLGTTWSIIASPIAGGTGSSNINSTLVLQSTENTTGLAANAYRGDAIPLPPWQIKEGEEYTVSFYSRTVSGSVAKGTVGVYARFLDVGGSLLSEALVSSYIDQSVTATLLRTAIVTAPAGAAYMNIRVRRGANAAGQSVERFWVWGLNVRRAMNATLIVDGSIKANHAEFGTVAADLLVIGGQVITGHVLANAMSVSGADTASSAVNITGSSGPSLPTSFVDVASVTITPDGGDVLVIATGTVYARSAAASAYGTVEAGIRRGTTAVAVQECPFDDGTFSKSTYAIVYIDTSPGTSPITYRNSGRCIVGDFPGDCSHATVRAGAGIMAFNLKK